MWLACVLTLSAAVVVAHSAVVQHGSGVDGAVAACVAVLGAGAAVMAAATTSSPERPLLRAPRVLWTAFGGPVVAQVGSSARAGHRRPPDLQVFLN